MISIPTFHQRCLAAGAWLCCSAAAMAESAKFVLPEKAGIILENRCQTCHEEGTEKGDLRLDNLAELPLDARLETFNRMREQVHFKQMPPPDKKSQPTDEERGELLSWLAGELHRHKASKLEDKLRYPDYGNAVDHEQLFSGKIQAAAYTPARRWLVSPQIFHERVLDVFELEGRDRNITFYGVTNPFVLPEKSGVRYYDNDTLSGGHLLQMLANAQWITHKQIRPARVKNGEIGANDFPDIRDKWSPRSTPPAFETVILKKGAPTDRELTDVITTQFALVLRREPEKSELAKYLALAREAVRVGGNTEGLRQVLAAVLLESEFLYRYEFGAGPADSSGRRLLSPREGAFAISYALGDRGPDAALLEAAASGRLDSREDYHREVTRLLADQTYYEGDVDPTLNCGKYNSIRSAHPRIMRFFRDFFGYPGALKVFKDSKRSNGKYGNPDRGYMGTPGWLTVEADRIVALHVESDRDVFRKLLTFDEFFVYHNKDNETGKAIIDEWRGVYERLKNTDWKTDPVKVINDHLDFLKAQKTLQFKDASKPGELLAYMGYFEESFGQGRTPFTTVPWAHGYTLHHSPFYNLPPTPDIGRYGNWRNNKFIKREPMELWDYPTQQPFRIRNRMGILTHPAWLIAHSTNFHADAIRRGRWVREKLLAGRVPDIPITVDAQVPEDPHRTFRQRVETVTQPESCWKCHQYMNPLGLSFEMYDDFGRYRMEEFLENPENLIKAGNGKNTFDEYKTLPVVTTGKLEGTGDPHLDGDVKDAIDMIGRLAKSDRVRQSIIRHAFRFYMGRNELLSDSKTLIDADRAYVQSGGSFRAVIVSLLTSDSFLYRKPNAPAS
jgi:hypothetical protein